VPRIRIAFCSESRLWVEALEAALSRDSLFESMGRWPDKRPGREVPDVVLLDARMPDALRACAGLRKAGDRPRAILLGREADGRFGLTALESGARGILGQDHGLRDLAKAIRAVHEGQIWACADVIARGVEELAFFYESGRVQESAIARLSAREKEVALLVASGRGNKESAARLGISPATVKAHLTRIFEKLELRSRAELAAALHGGPKLDPGPHGRTTKV
jgi:DNA-binding NarL/FixJ family response regulator